jgi:SEL1 protein
MSALAMWNLGWMYENGVGVPQVRCQECMHFHPLISSQDFHLAKRHYDLALETNSEAYLPVTLSLGKLYLRSFWHTLIGGKGGVSIWNAGSEDHRGYYCFLSRFDSSSLTISLSGDDLSNPSEGRQVDDGRQKDGILDPKSDKDEEHKHFEGEDSPWYLGKAKEEFHKRRNQAVPSRREEDPIQVCSSDLMISPPLMTIMRSGRETAETLNKNEIATSVQKTTLMARCDPPIAKRSSTNSRRPCFLFSFAWLYPY